MSLSGPPSPPRDLVYTLKQSTLILEWAAPSDTGGRLDLTYSVGCRRCLGGQCEPCGASVGFVPQQVGLTERTVTVVNLLPNSNYTFAVEALNGVSELLPSKRFYAQVNVSTSLPGESRVDLRAWPRTRQGRAYFKCHVAAQSLRSKGTERQRSENQVTLHFPKR